MTRRILYEGMFRVLPGAVFVLCADVVHASSIVVTIAKDSSVTKTLTSYAFVPAGAETFVSLWPASKHVTHETMTALQCSAF